MWYQGRVAEICTFILTVTDCKKPTPYCYNGIATVVMSTSGRVTIWASDLDAGSYDNCSAKSNLTFSFGPDRSQINKEFTCSDILNGKSATIPLDIYVWDEAGQLILQDLFSVAGWIIRCMSGYLTGIQNNRRKHPNSGTLVRLEDKMAFRKSLH